MNQDVPQHATPDKLVTVGVLIKVLTILVPISVGVSWYLADFGVEYCMLQVTNTEDRVTRVAARHREFKRMINLRLLVLEAGSGPVDPAVINAIKAGIESLEAPDAK